VVADCGTCDKTIFENALQLDDLRSFGLALKAAGLEETLSAEGPFTVFAPTNRGYAKLPKETVATLNTAKLTAILTYHVVPGQLMAADVVKLKKAKTVQGAEVGVKVSEGKAMVDNATVTVTDIKCSNGVIHVIDSVILPRDIVDTAVAAGKFKTLAAALKAADLVKILKGDGPFTVFAPTDEAFKKLPADTVEDLLKPENKAKLTAILSCHVLPYKVMAKDVMKLDKLQTLQRSRVTIKAEGKKVMVDNATVVAADIVCSNGVVHVIDSVLLPK
jgi:uncharacterized surface protein with fasciclin (FAS1) repeats